MWRFVAPHFETTHRVITFDHVGAGGSDPTAHDATKYSTLSGYATDVLEICAELNLHDVVFVGHSVSSMIGVIAAIHDPERFAALILVSPSPLYILDGAYVAGVTRADIDGLISSMESNYLGWSAGVAPMIMGNPDRPELGEELTESFCRADPTIAKQFARVTFLSDNRADLGSVAVPTLVLQCRNDAIAPVQVGEFVRDAIAGSTYVVLDATGHCPNLSAPDVTSAAIASFVGGLAPAA